MPAFTFTPCSKLVAALLKSGAAKYNMDYHGIVKTGLNYDGKEVGPAAWTNKARDLVLLLFEEADGAEYALVAQNPAAEDVVADFMGGFGHSVADLVAATPVRFTTRDDGGGGESIAPEGESHFSNFNPDAHHYAFIGSDPGAMNGDDAQYVTVDGSAMDRRPAEVWFAEQIGGNMAGQYIAALRFKIRARGASGRSLHAVCDQGDRILCFGLFTFSDGEWADLVSPWFDVAGLGLDFGYGENGMAYGGVSLHAPGGAVDVGDLALEFTSFTP
jgi:hypothetical protein